MINDEVLSAKKSVVDEIADKIDKAESMVLVEYQGLSVTEFETLRNQLREENVEIKVYKNTLTRLAVEKLGHKSMKGDLIGPNALAFSNEDAVAAARVLAKFAKEHEALKIKTGIVEGNLVTTETLNELALLPSREGLLSMLLSCLQAPARDMAMVVDALAKKVEEETASETSEEASTEAKRKEEATKEADNEAKGEEDKPAAPAETKEPQPEAVKEEPKKEAPAKAEESKKEEVKEEKPAEKEEAQPEKPEAKAEEAKEKAPEKETKVEETKEEKTKE